MAYAYTPKTRLDKLNYSPTDNPLAIAAEIRTKTKFVRSGRAEMLVNVETQEVTHASMMHQITEIDEAHFVKIFAQGVTAMFDLSRTAQKVFALVLKRYQESEMPGGYSDCIDLFWFDDKLDGQAIGITEQTFKKGLRELLDKQFLYPRIPHSYWINPNLIFKGDRVVFIKEWRKKAKAKGKALAEKAGNEKWQQKAALPDRDPNTIDYINNATDRELAK